MSNAKPRLGYIGLGFMGQPMALRLLDQGFEMSVWARNPERLGKLVAAGAKACATPAAVAQASDIVITCVTDTAAVKAIVLGEDGLADGAAAGKTLIDMSSIEPRATVEMAAELRRRCAMAWIDAPVSGGPAACAAGTLTVMAGGDGDDFARVKPLLEVLAARLTLMGPNGTGQTTKLVNQALVGGGLALVAEALQFAQDAGVDAARIPAALAGGRADSAVLQEWGPRMAAKDYAPTGTVNIIRKDLDTVVRAAQGPGTPMPMVNAAGDIFRQAARRGFGELDVCAVKKVYEAKD
jgi:3-hydroxyisobutyrate dehydrogenase